MDVTASPPFDRLWRGQDPLRWIEAAGGEHLRELPDRRTTRVEVEGEVFFAKVHRGVGIRETLRSLASLRLPVFDARAEVMAIARLREAGVDVPEVVAWGVDEGAPPHRRRSFVVTRDVGTQRTLADVASELQPDALRERRAWTRALGRIVGAMHAAGVNHRDCYLVHVLCPEPAPGAAPRPVLLDLHRAQIRAAVPQRWRAKDLGGLAFSAMDAELTRTDLLRFIRAYAGGSAAAALRATPSLWRAVEARRAGLVAERARRGERFGR
ncbi:MAG: lipopolysaccharide core heptose(I) kinase RfaP [Planctomycetota bacterium]|nr:lipopolysaccharide core heptose(I) kinase RfaP [Planctomycetota bacterium]